MEPRYLAEEVIGHPNHQLRIWLDAWGKDVIGFPPTPNHPGWDQTFRVGLVAVGWCGGEECRGNSVATGWHPHAFSHGLWFLIHLEFEWTWYMFLYVLFKFWLKIAKHTVLFLRCLKKCPSHFPFQRGQFFVKQVEDLPRLHAATQRSGTALVVATRTMPEVRPDSCRVVRLQQGRLMQVEQLELGLGEGVMFKSLRLDVRLEVLVKG